MGWRDVGFMGSEYYETPNIDKIAEQGMVFTNAYSNAPNCAPARACVLVGPAYADEAQVYTVQPGDTMLTIAAWHNLTATQLASANGLRWAAPVHAGQKLSVPDAEALAANQETGTYTVRPGDTLIGIAARHGVSVSQLASANGLRTNSWAWTMADRRYSTP